MTGYCEPGYSHKYVINITSTSMLKSRKKMHFSSTHSTFTKLVFTVAGIIVYKMKQSRDDLYYWGTG
jgi:hypothetical protein